MGGLKVGRCFLAAGGARRKGRVGNYILDNGCPVCDAAKRQAGELFIQFTPEMRVVGERLMAAWADPDPSRETLDDLGSCYGTFLERLFREVLACHSPAVSVRGLPDG
jgi:hypothetical protein